MAWAAMKTSIGWCYWMLLQDDRAKVELGKPVEPKTNALDNLHLA